MDFIIDDQGDETLAKKTELLSGKEAEEKRNFLLNILENTRHLLDEKCKLKHESGERLNKLKIDKQFDNFFEDMGWSVKPGVPNIKKKKIPKSFHFDDLDAETGKLNLSTISSQVDKMMEKSVIKPGIEKEHSLPEYNVSQSRLKAMRKKEREKTKGPNWFGIKAPELTEELKNDLQALKMRSVMDPKHFYKKNDMEVLPKYFQVGRVLDSSLDHMNERLTRKQRKKTIVDELLADAEFNKYNKKKYKEIIEEKKKREYRTHMRDKRKKWKSQDSSKKSKKSVN